MRWSPRGPLAHIQHEATTARRSSDTADASRSPSGLIQRYKVAVWRREASFYCLCAMCEGSCPDATLVEFIHKNNVVIGADLTVLWMHKHCVLSWTSVSVAWYTMKAHNREPQQRMDGRKSLKRRRWRHWSGFHLMSGKNINACCWVPEKIGDVCFHTWSPG